MTRSVSMLALAGSALLAGCNDYDDLRAGVAYAREHAERVGRTRPLEIAFIPVGFTMGDGGIDVAGLAEELPRYEAAGVTWLSLGVPCETAAEYRERIWSLRAGLP